MELAESYRMAGYQDFGPLENKAHIHLVRQKSTGRICVKKYLDPALRDVVFFRKNCRSSFFPEILEMEEVEEHILIIEEYVEGVTLDEYMMGESLQEEKAVRFARQICEALGCLHRASPMIIYRDLKPENVMITLQDEVKLIDFHISRNYQQGKKRDTVLMGTAEYAAPEQFGYFQTDNRTDIYAFGVLFNYMLTGKFPIERTAWGKYEKIIRKCIELEPGRRYQSVWEILRELPTEKKNETVSETADERKIESWKLPGFRSGVLWKKVIAIIGYCFVLYLGLSSEFKNSDGVPYTPAVQWINRIMITLSQIITILFCANYRGISADIRILRHRFLLIRIIAYLITWVVCMVLAVMAASILETVLPL